MRSKLILVVAAAVALQGGAFTGAEKVSSAAATASAPLIDGPAIAFALPERGDQVQTRPILPPSGPPPCQRVVVVGDSLTDNSLWWLNQGLRNAGFTQHVDAHHSRRIPASVRAPYSGVKAALSVRATWGEASCWVVALGSNDLVRGANRPAIVSSLLDEMLEIVSPDAHVWWVNLDYHRDPSTSFDFVGATTVFNAKLDARAASNPQLHVIDWYTYAEANLQWFFDPVHVNRTGSIARANQIIEALPR
jgi:hypothetical protein